MPGRVKGFAPWRPQKRTQALLEDIEVVLEEYEAYLPLTIRQVFYRLVGKGHPKTENFYASVQEACNRARRSERISFDAIRDDGVSRLAGKRSPTRVRKSITRRTTSSSTRTGVAGTLINPLTSLCCARRQAWCRCLEAPSATTG